MSSGAIAIVGMAGVFPGAPTLAVFWQNILHGRSAVADPPPQAWDVAALYDPHSTATNRLYCQKGGYLGDLASFDPLLNGVPPAAVEGTDPDQWMALETARRALADAGYGDEIAERARTAVIIGRGAYINRGNTLAYQHGSLIDEAVGVIGQLLPQLGDDGLALLREGLGRHLPPYNADVAQGLIPNLMAGRIANKLDLMGPAYTVDAACASSAIALEHAVHGLRAGRYDLALAGGAYIVSPAPMALLLSQLRVLSRQGAIRSFDAAADGTVLGEGIGLVALKRLEDALADGHRIYAVLRGIGSSADGSGRSAIAPRLEGVLTAMRRAYADAGDVTPAALDLIEGHGIGTPLGDAVELQALAALLAESRPARPVALGSVKPLIGHLLPASGIAAVIKTALALHHRVLPAAVNCAAPRPAIDWEAVPLRLPRRPEPWSAVAGRPRRAAVNSFGFGGVSAHLVLEEAPADHRPRRSARPLPEGGARIVLNTNRPTLHLPEDAAAAVRRALAAQGATHMEPIHHNGNGHHPPAPLTPPAPPAAPAALHPLAPAMLAAYAQLMTEFLHVQRDVMQSLLGGAPPAGGWSAVPTALPAPLPPIQLAPTATATPPVAVPPLVAVAPQPTPPVAVQQSAGAAAPAGPPARGEILAALTALVGERTGYPSELIGEHVNLEGELGIDSIKRVEIMGAFQQQYGDWITADQMDDLTTQKTLGQIADLVSARARAAAGGTPAPFERRGADAPHPPYPTIRAILDRQGDQSVTAEALLDPHTHGLLADHTLGRDLARLTPDLHGLPVMPMMGSLELLAEAAALLNPGRPVARVRNAYAWRWLVAEEPLVVTLRARRMPNGYTQSQLFLPGDDRPTAEAAFAFVDDAAALPAATLTIDAPADGRAPRWSAEQLYESSGMFHGPRLQGVVALEAVGRDGIAATLRRLPADDLLPGVPAPAFVLDPVLLDQLAQLVGFWSLHELPDRTIVLPYHIRELQIHTPAPAVGAPLTARARIAAVGNQRTRSDLSVVAPDGAVWLTVHGLEGQRFALPAPFFAAAFASGQDAPFSEPVAGVPAQTATAVRRIRPTALPADFLHAYGGIWLRALAYSVLSPQERTVWRELTLPPERRAQWLLGRIAAKEAVCAWLAEQHNLALRPADVVIATDAQGSPQAEGSWQAQVNAAAPTVSIAHAGEIVVAALSDRGAVGVDVEPLRPFPPDALTAAFATAELTLLPDDAARWRAWCAKEAFAKARGGGLAPRSLTTTAVTADAVTLHAQTGRVRTHTVHTACRDGFALAVATLTPDASPRRDRRRAAQPDGSSSPTSQRN